jgi:hypothetical protein
MCSVAVRLPHVALHLQSRNAQPTELVDLGKDSKRRPQRYNCLLMILNGALAVCYETRLTASSYLCPGNTRANGDKNEDYASTFIFEVNLLLSVKSSRADFEQNDYAAVKEEQVSHTEPDDPLFRLEPARGKCYVICFNPNHALTLAELKKEDIVPIVKTWWVL